MSIHFIALSRRAPICEECNGDGEVWVDNDNTDLNAAECHVCGGAGHLAERTDIHRVAVGQRRLGVLYDQPGAARGSVKRSIDGDEDAAFRVLKVDTDDLEEDEHGWDDARKYQHAEARMLYWTERFERLQRQQDGETFQHRYDPRLTIGDLVLLREILGSVASGVHGWRKNARERAADILARLDAKVMFDKLDERAIQSADAVRKLVDEHEGKRR